MVSSDAVDVSSTHAPCALTSCAFKCACMGCKDARTLVFGVDDYTGRSHASHVFCGQTYGMSLLSDSTSKC